jgi:hypothetical protein
MVPNGLKEEPSHATPSLHVPTAHHPHAQLHHHHVVRSGATGWPGMQPAVMQLDPATLQR